jgi:hypothetical protein
MLKRIWFERVATHARGLVIHAVHAIIYISSTGAVVILAPSHPQKQVKHLLVAQGGLAFLG